MPSNLTDIYSSILVKPAASISNFYTENGDSKFPWNVNCYQSAQQHIQDCSNVK
jgi:hypothetical protein